MGRFGALFGQRLLMKNGCLTVPKIIFRNGILKFVNFLGRLKVIFAIKGGHFKDTPSDARRMPAIRINGVTGRRTEPGKHAHAFRMTLVGRDKLPQININFLFYLFINKINSNYIIILYIYIYIHIYFFKKYVLY